MGDTWQAFIDFSQRANPAWAWIITYLIHSTVLIGGAILIHACCRRLSESVRELLLRAALLGSIITATFAVTAPVSIRDPFDVQSVLTSAVSTETPDVAETLNVDESALALEFSTDEMSAWGEIPPPPSSVAREPQVSWLGEVLLASPTSLAVMLPAAMLGLALGVATVARAQRRFHSMLRNRTMLTVDFRGRRMLDDLLARNGSRAVIRLSASAQLEAPIAFGLLDREICLPLHRLDEIGDLALRLMLAHELAHLLRRDPMWSLVLRLIECALFFQPLNVLARRALRRVAEFQCDAWAAHMTGQRTAMARVLADVAQWLVRGNTDEDALAAAASMAERRSWVRQRIERLLEDAPAPGRSRRTIAVAGIAAAGLMLAAVTPPLTGTLQRDDSAFIGDESLASLAPTDDVKATDVAGALREVLDFIGEDLRILEGEAASLARRAAILPADETLDTLLAEIREQIEALREQQAELLRSLDELPPDSALSESDEMNTDAALRARNSEPPITTGRRPQ